MATHYSASPAQKAADEAYYKIASKVRTMRAVREATTAVKAELAELAKTSRR